LKRFIWLGNLDFAGFSEELELHVRKAEEKRERDRGDGKNGGGGSKTFLIESYVLKGGLQTGW